MKTLELNFDAARLGVPLQRMVIRTAKCKKLEDVRDMQAGFSFVACSCGKIPKLREIHAYPAQYRVECECGNYALGRYWSYAEDDGTMRHLRSSLDALHAWNRRRDIQNESEEEAWRMAERKKYNAKPSDAGGVS